MTQTESKSNRKQGGGNNLKKEKMELKARGKRERGKVTEEKKKKSLKFGLDKQRARTGRYGGECKNTQQRRDKPNIKEKTA